MKGVAAVPVLKPTSQALQSCLLPEEVLAARTGMVDPASAVMIKMREVVVEHQQQARRTQDQVAALAHQVSGSEQQAVLVG